MASRGINRVTLIGNLGNDPETKFMPSGSAVTNITVATSETWKSKETGQQEEATEWHRVSAFGKLAEIMGQYLHKGSKVYIEGKLKTRKWQAQDGSDRYSTDIIASELQMLDSKGDSAPKQAAPQQQSQGASVPDDISDEIPFARIHSYP